MGAKEDHQATIAATNGQADSYALSETEVDDLAHAVVNAYYKRGQFTSPMFHAYRRADRYHPAFVAILGPVWEPFRAALRRYEGFDDHAQTLNPSAFYGPIGSMVQAIAPYAEAHPAAILLSKLTLFGNMVGPSPHHMVRSDRHGCNIFTAIVGPSSKGAKGESYSDAKGLLTGIDPAWDAESTWGGFGSGEGLIRHLAERELPGADMRTVIVEREWTHALKVAARDGSVLAEVLRNLFDGSPVHSIIRDGKKSLYCNQHYVSFIGHITPDALLGATSRSLLTADGSLNRFLFTAVRRVRRIDRDEPLPPDVQAEITEQQALLRGALDRARHIGHVPRTFAAEAQWRDIMDEVENVPEGEVGDLLSRARSHILRLSLIYAMADGVKAIDVPHQQAALAVWQFSRDSVSLIFDPRPQADRSTTGVADADRLYRRLIETGELRRGQVHALFHNNRSNYEIDRLVAILTDHGWAKEDTEPQPPGQRGRPAKVLRSLPLDHPV